MLSIARMTGPSAGDYWSSLSREDYYTNGGEPPGKWLGAGSVALSLGGTVQAAELRAILAGVNPGTGEALGQHQGGQHHPGWDFCFSAPKGVSVVWSQAPEELRQAIQQAQARAVAAGIHHLESEAALTRRGKGGRETERPVGLVAASYEHGTSREQDPQLHTHVLIANIAPRQDGTWGTLETRQMYAHKMAAGAIYRAELAAEIQRLGFAIEPDGKGSFRVAGVDPAIENHCSKRREQIETALEAQGYDSAKAAEVAALDTRKSKEAVPRAELFTRWQAAAAELGFDLAAVQTAEAAESREPLTRAQILRGLTEQSSTFSEADLWRAVAVDSQGHRDAAGIAAEVRALLQDPELVRLEAADGSDRYSTREMVRLESDLAARAEARAEEQAHKIDEAALEQAKAARTLSPEQLQALDHITGPGGVVLVQGMAGTGKSYLLGAAREAWELSDYEVRGASLAGKAAAGLQESASINSQTIHSLLDELDQGQRPLTSKTILVVDEAGMVGSRMMARLLDQAHAAGAKVVLVGDSRQLQPIDAGGAFRALQDRLGAAGLTGIIRQREGWARAAVHQFADGEAALALEAYRERGLVSVAPTRLEAMQAMVRDWRATWSPSRPAETLMLASSRAEVAKLNALARAQLAGEKLLGPGCKISLADGRALEIREGDRVLATRNSRALGLQNGTLATVERILPGKGGEGWQVTIRADDGRRVTFNPEKYSNLAHGYAVTTHKAQGVTVDDALILGGGTMTSREMAYVQMSRHRHSARLYIDQAEATQAQTLAELAKDMSRERLADTTLDYKAVDHQPAAEGSRQTPQATTTTQPQPAPERELDELEL